MDPFVVDNNEHGTTDEDDEMMTRDFNEVRLSLWKQPEAAVDELIVDNAMLLLLLLLKISTD